MRENKALILETELNTLIKHNSPDANKPVFVVKINAVGNEYNHSIIGYGNLKDQITTLISCIKTLNDQKSKETNADKLDFIEKQLSFIKKNIVKIDSDLKSLKDSGVDEKLLTEYLELFGLKNASTIVHLFYWLDKNSYTLEKALSLISPKKKEGVFFGLITAEKMNSIDSNKVIDHLRKCIDERPSNNKTTQTEFSSDQVLKTVLAQANLIQEQANLIKELQTQMANMQTQISRLAIPDSAETKRSPTLFK